MSESLTLLFLALQKLVLEQIFDERPKIIEKKQDSKELGKNECPLEDEGKESIDKKSLKAKPEDFLSFEDKLPIKRKYQEDENNFNLDERKSIQVFDEGLSLYEIVRLVEKKMKKNRISKEKITPSVKKASFIEE